MRPTTRGFVAITLSALAFGGVAVLTKLALFSGLSVLTVSFWRWSLAALALAPFALVTARGRLTRRAALGGVLLGMVGQFATSGIYAASLLHAPAAVAAFLLYLNPVFVALLAAAFLGERLSARGIVALVVAIGGLALLALAPGGAAEPIGVALALLSAVFYAGTIVTARRLGAGAPPLAFAWCIMLGASVAFGTGALVTGTLAAPADAHVWLILAILAVVGTSFAVGAFYVALALIGAPRASLVSTLEPVSTIFVAYLVLGETLDLARLVGAGLVLVAVALLVSER